MTEMQRHSEAPEAQQRTGGARWDMDSAVLTIAKEFHFSASHVLDALPSWHQCARMHGHNYLVVLELAARRDQLTRAGFVRDYGDLDVFKKWLDEVVDHRHLNEVMGELSPSAENLACWVFARWTAELPELVAVRVSETPRTWAEFRPTRRMPDVVPDVQHPLRGERPANRPDTP